MADYRRIAPAAQVYRHCPMCTGLLHDRCDPVNGFLRPTCGECGWVYFPAAPIGAIVVVEHRPGIVLVHPPGGPPDAPASLPGAILEYGETPQDGAVRAVREQTGLEVELGAELIRFQQPGTPFGPVLMFGYTATMVGGALRSDGHEGPAVAYAIDNMPAIIAVRAANQRVLAAYLEAPTMAGPERR